MERELLIALIALSTGALVSFIFEVLQQNFDMFDRIKVEEKRIAVLFGSAIAVITNLFLGLDLLITGYSFSSSMLNMFLISAIAFATFHLVIEKRIVVKLINWSDLVEDTEPTEDLLPILIGPGCELHIPPTEIIEVRILEYGHVNENKRSYSRIAFKDVFDQNVL